MRFGWIVILLLALIAIGAVLPAVAGAQCVQAGECGIFGGFLPVPGPGEGGEVLAAPNVAPEKAALIWRLPRWEGGQVGPLPPEPACRPFCVEGVSAGQDMP